MTFAGISGLYGLLAGQVAKRFPALAQYGADGNANGV
jgi:hypothetical protein